MKKQKRILSLILALVISLVLVPGTALAADSEAEEAAQSLYELGLFNGIGANADGTPNFDLDRAPTRQEAITMLVRLLGKEKEAQAGTWEIPFTDVDDWAKPYVGYAYTNHLTGGTSPTTFSGNDTVTATQYLTFVLRALGYQDGADFQWDKAWELSDRIELTDGSYNAETTFTRGDVAIISESALSMTGKGNDVTLLSQLVNAKVVDKAAADLFSYPRKVNFTNAFFSSNIDRIKYNGKLYEWGASTSEYEISFPRMDRFMIDTNTGDLYFDLGRLYSDMDIHIPYCSFPFSITESENPYLDGKIIFNLSSLDIKKDYVTEYLSADKKFYCYTWTINGISYTGIDAEKFCELLDNGLSDGDTGIHDGVHFAYVNSRMYDEAFYFSANDLADHFGLKHHFSYKDGTLIITDVEEAGK